MSSSEHSSKLPGADVRDPGVWLIKITSGARPVRSKDKVNQKRQRPTAVQKQRGVSGRWVGDKPSHWNTQETYEQDVAKNGAGNVIDKRTYVVEGCWYEHRYDIDRQCLVFSPQYIDEAKTIRYKTLIWLTMVRTHAKRGVQPVDTVALYPYNRDVPEQDRPFAVNQRQYQAIIKHCIEDELLYKQNAKQSKKRKRGRPVFLEVDE